MMDEQTLLGTVELRAPLQGDVAAGADPRGDVSPSSLYYRLRDARAEARAEERAADNDPAAPESGLRNWRTVAALASDILRTQGKDIEVASWLTESLVRLDGLAGLAAGSDLLCAFVELYWRDGLHPLPDEDGVDARLTPIAGLSGVSGDGTLLQPLRKIMLFRDPAGEDVTFWRFEQARTGASLPDVEKRSASMARLAVFEGIARGAGRTEITDVAQQARRAIAAWDALERALQSSLDGAETPPMRRVRELLESVARLAETYAPAPAQPPLELALDVTGKDRKVSVGAQETPALDREAMLDEVLRVAIRFRAAEPTSPFSYTIEDAVRRARLSWPAFLEEMLPDPAARTALLTGLGIRVAQG